MFEDLISVGFFLLAVATFVWRVRKESGNKKKDPDLPHTTNSAGDEGRLDRSAQRANSVGERPALSRRQRMVEEQRQRAEAYRQSQAAARGKGPSEPGLCPGCGRTLTQVEDFCLHCGRSVRPAANGLCPTCGGPVTTLAYFCPGCGLAMPVDIPAPAGKGAKGAAALCPKCGRELKAGGKFCPGCGTATAANAAVAVSNTAADASVFAQGGSEPAYSYSDGDRPPAPVSPDAPPAPRRGPAFTLPAFTGQELAKSLVMAEILGPCKARQQH